MKMLWYTDNRYSKRNTAREPPSLNMIFWPWVDRQLEKDTKRPTKGDMTCLARIIAYDTNRGCAHAPLPTPLPPSLPAQLLLESLGLPAKCMIETVRSQSDPKKYEPVFIILSFYQNKYKYTMTRLNKKRFKTPHPHLSPFGRNTLGPTSAIPP